MEDLDKDIVVFNDEEGNEIELEVVDYFDYENEEYAVMIDPAAVDDDERDLFVFRIQVNGEYEEFLPADEDKMDILSKIVDALLRNSCAAPAPAFDFSHFFISFQEVFLLCLLQANFAV